MTDVILALRDLGALVRVDCEGVAELERLGLFREPLEELVVDARLHEDARTGAASLTVIPAKKPRSVRAERGRVRGTLTRCRERTS